ncbi:MULTISPECIES: cytochrome b [Raoultella]|uniref:cytochrome b n=1 Tax=Raoultella TaxID=160674 RepID=UPI002168A7CC|nr:MULTISPECIES: cytochrome b [Raoultella]MCS4273121.1 cytochrome b561 [Raoultella sp. BIGb0132]MCS4289507.1 cytochrome b561 [Raoultella terrigena]
MKQQSPTARRQRYDRLTLTLHWLTAACVIFLFSSAHIWAWLERGTPLRKELQALHISCGIVLAMTIVVRLLWRIISQRSPRYALPPAPLSRPTKLAAHAVHGTLYLLLFAQAALGFLFRWAQQEPFRFFGGPDLSGWVSIDPALRHSLGEWHNNVAWALIILACAHALAALAHHYLLHDGVLSRMLPGRAGR